jgi:hypothetical protein
MLYTTDAQPRIKAQTAWGVTGRLGKTPMPDTSIAEATIPFGDSEIASRVHKAFIHAINSCKTKEEPF